MRVYATLAAAACLLLLSGCVHESAGHAVPAGSAPNTDSDTLPTGDLRLPQPRSADVCSLLGEDVGKRFGSVERSLGSDFHRCSVTISPCVSRKDPADLSESEIADLLPTQKKCLKRATNPVTEPVRIQLALQDTSAFQEPKLSQAPTSELVPFSALDEIEVDGHVALEFPNAAHECGYAVPFQSDSVLTIHVESDSEASDEDALCALSRDTLDNAVEKLASDGVDQFDRPTDSFVHLDLCGLIEPGDVALDGVDWSRTLARGFGRHCVFRDDQSTTAMLDLMPKHVPQTEDSATTGPKELADKPTWVADYKDEMAEDVERCEVETTRENDPPKPLTQTEMATVTVEHNTKTEPSGMEVCDAAKSIAKNIWPKLDDD